MSHQLDVERHPVQRLFYLISEKKGFCLPTALTEQKFVMPQQREISKLTRTMPKAIRSFYEKRYYLFSQFDKGIRLDEESWYSVVPEPVAAHVARRVSKFHCVLDAFCGSGGLTIQLSKHCQKVLANDLDASKVENARHNCTVYGLGQNVQFICNDFLQFEAPQQQKIDCVILCPPWGGKKYKRKDYFDLEEDMYPALSAILQKAFALSENILLQLPRNILLAQLVEQLGLALRRQQKQHFLRLEIELVKVNDNLEQLFVYFGACASTIQQKNELNLLCTTFEMVQAQQRQRMRAQLDSGNALKIYDIVAEYFKRVEEEEKDVVTQQQLDQENINKKRKPQQLPVNDKFFNNKKIKHH